MLLNLLLSMEVCIGTKLISKSKKMVADDNVSHQPSILYRDVPKAGGSTTVKLLQSMVDRDAFGGVPVRIVEEYEPLNLTTALTDFVIGALREPCSYYVSLFGFSGNTFLGRGHKHLRVNVTSNESVPMFHDWLGEVLKKRHGLTPTRIGVVSLRFWLLYAGGNGPPLHQADQMGRYDSSTVSQGLGAFFSGSKGRTRTDKQSRPVDCWVETSVLTDGLEECLHKFVERHPSLGSRLHWDTIEKVLHPPVVSQSNGLSAGNKKGGRGDSGGMQTTPAAAFGLAGKEQQRERHRRLRMRGFYQVTATHFNASPHLPCAAYFDPATKEGERARQLVASRDAALNSHFGFECCGGSTLLSQGASAMHNQRH